MNFLIDALRWNPKNTSALIMMGNTLFKHNQDIDNALLYYNSVLEVNPEDYVALNNIGSNLMQSGNFKKAEGFFQKALKIDPDYSNTHLGLAFVFNNQKDYQKVFEHSLKAISTCNKIDQVYKASFDLAVQSAKEIITVKSELQTVKGYAAKLEIEGDKQIKFEEDNNISTLAKIEFAENHDRTYHLVKYKSNQLAYEHLILHELIHLDFVIQARKAKKNELFIAKDEHRTKFYSNLIPWKKKMQKQGHSQSSVNNIEKSLFDGLNLQVYNTPIDLFIEDFIFDNFISLRPFQFLSLLQMLKEGIKATTDKRISKVMPNWIVSKSKIYHTLNILHFKTLFGVNP